MRHIAPHHLEGRSFLCVRPASPAWRSRGERFLAAAAAGLRIAAEEVGDAWLPDRSTWGWRLLLDVNWP